MLGLWLFLIKIHVTQIADHHIHFFRKPEQQKTTLFALTLTVKYLITLTLTVKFTFSSFLHTRECKDYGYF